MGAAPPFLTGAYSCSPLASQGLGALLSANKDFLVDTLTWPVVFGEEGFRGSLWGLPISTVDWDAAVSH